MDKDLQDAVLAAFDGEPKDETTTTDQARDDAAAEGATVVLKPGNTPKKTLLSATGTGRRLPATATTAIRKAAPVHEPEAEPVAAPAAPTPARRPAAPVHAPAPGARGTLSLLLTAVLAVLVVILLVQTLSLKAAVGRQEAMLKDLKNLARITVSVYQEPGKRPQRVIAVHDLDTDGKLKPVKMTIVPLEEE